jgi:hypothetical protein
MVRKAKPKRRRKKQGRRTQRASARPRKQAAPRKNPRQKPQRRRKRPRSSPLIEIAVGEMNRGRSLTAAARSVRLPPDELRTQHILPCVNSAEGGNAGLHQLSLPFFRTVGNVREKPKHLVPKVVSNWTHECSWRSNGEPERPADRGDLFCASCGRSRRWLELASQS